MEVLGGVLFIGVIVGIVVIREYVRKRAAQDRAERESRVEDGRPN